MDRRLSCVAAAVAGLIVIGGCGLGGHDADPVSAVAAPASVEPPVETTDPVVEVTDSPTLSPSPSKPRTRKPKPKPSKTSATPTEDPNNFQLPACAHREGKAVSKTKAKAALRAAAAKTYWPTSAPELKVPSRLVLATAWHESGWQSNIVNCDGGLGLMQVMPDTEAFINQRFGQTFDSGDYQQNAVLGANYLAWLTKVFGDSYFKGSYDLSAAKCKTHSSMCLLNMVIAGYNVGRGPVDEAYGNKQLPNAAYVDVVRSLMASCYCDKY
ncbi:transglycosylase SLT domain-containing protein [Actinoplanes sp. N902-109]|uniref:transglycosylase SLT domain-containing protein n=1 Tax=Actinoplanes sp. (strain N902-109) TaxID=649831 RepID=UPI000329667E|nr:transglycosylase SLT domain-containing protein [Actinoplanes sp. N902-109]AGL15640.1 lytic transglycosylase catalytic subunit [Actinoplanes sp. N902-109]